LDELPPTMLFADDGGRIYDHPHLEMVGFDGAQHIRPHLRDTLPLPEFSKLFYLPGCPPLGYDRRRRQLRLVREIRIGSRSHRCHAVAAFPEPGFARTLSPSADYSHKTAVLPLWAYTAVGFTESGNRMAAFRVEDNPTWDPRNYDDRDLAPAVSRMMRLRGRNPLVRHLRKCAVENHCFAAKNLFLQRWEAPLPVSRTCNARCLGCLSLQPKDSCAASHRRISFRPTVEQVVDVAVPHLMHAEGSIVSFGQGCEGEPLMEAPLIQAAVRDMRKETQRGTINLNTNGSLPDPLTSIVDAGLDSVRISLNSARPDAYHAYYRPRGYDFEQVRESLARCTARNCFTMINYLIFPGVTDREDEIHALFRLIEATGVRFIHFKNLCIDPSLYLQSMPGPRSPLLGIRTAYEHVRRSFPEVSIGYFNQRPLDAAR